MSSYRGFYDSQAYDLPTQSGDGGADGRTAQQQQQQQVWEPRGLTPLTIKQILQILRAGPGQYSEESRRGSQAHFFLHDGTGQLYCSCTLERHEAMLLVFDAVQHTKSYLAVVGKVKPGNTNLFVYHARLVTDYNEITHHCIECAYEYLKETKAKAAAAAAQAQQPLQLPGHRVYPDRQPPPPAFQATSGPRTFAPHAPYNSFTAQYNPPPGRNDVGKQPVAVGGMSRSTPSGASYNANSLAHFAPTASSIVWPPPPSAADQLRSSIIRVLRKYGAVEDGVALRTMDVELPGVSLIQIQNEVCRMSEAGVIYSAKDEQHFKLV